MIATHLCISGYRQSIGYNHGVLDTQEKLIAAGHNDGVRSRVIHGYWNDNWKHYAEYISYLAARYNDGGACVGIYAYSWGAGWGAMQAAHYLGKNGITVYAMVLADPVYRHPAFFMRWTSLVQRNLMIFGGPVIKLPRNVNSENVYSFHQIMNRPQAHRIVTHEGADIHSELVRNRDHQHMDEAPEFHARCLEVARDIRRQCALAR